MDITHSQIGQSLEFKFSGQFTFADNQKFRDMINMIRQHESKSVSLNFAAVEFVDSAALGMLLLLRDITDKERIALQLAEPHGQVEKMFTLSKFDTLFQLA